ncbi:biogenesis protein MshI [Marinobacter salicampi]|uniref:biogenesis protein MshI n=1 Tax=Marinobacter salicampi TaxID=435907 RepID=UPI001F5E76DF|nr:biogenesis protein MshI [Marinobacter salicampi]
MTVSLFQRLLKRSGGSGRLYLEVCPEGLSWSLARNGSATTAGFVTCDTAKRADALAELVSSSSLSRMSTSLILPLNHYSVFQLERPEELADTELAGALRWKLKDLLDYNPSEAVCDVFPFPGDASRGRGTLVNVVAARKALAADLVNLVSQAGLTLDNITIAELALRNFAAALDPQNRGVALVHLRDSYGQMIICKGPILYLSRRLDVTAGDLRDASRQEQAVQSLALEMQRSLDYFESQLGQVPPRAIHLVARDAVLPLASMLSSYMAPVVETIDWSAQGLGEPLDSRCLSVWSAAQPIAGGVA